jgi:hypothetical protein
MAWSNYNGTDNISFTVVDDQGVSTTQSMALTIASVNDAVVIDNVYATSSTPLVLRPLIIGASLIELTLKLIWALVVWVPSLTGRAIIL